MKNNSKFIPVHGYLSQNWYPFNRETPAVVMNPEAQTLDLVAWCWGELQSMQAAVNVLANSADSINKGDFSALIVHRMDALSGVFEIAVSRLIDEKRNPAKPEAAT